MAPEPSPATRSCPVGCYGKSRQRGTRQRGLYAQNSVVAVGIAGRRIVRKILSIDGGGIKGVFPASFLATVEDTVGRNVGDFFDLIVGTSTGGVIALGLGMGMSAREILQFYEELGPAVFHGNRLGRLFRSLVRARYDQGPLREALTKTFGDRQLGESKTRLVIPSLHLETGEVYIHKTSHVPHLQRDYKERVVDVALATAAAPTYFPPQRSASGIPLVDGGMWANNPVGMAAVEAVGYLCWPRDEIHILSLGCTTAPFKVGRLQRQAPGLINWGLRVAEVFMAGQASASLGTAQILVGHDHVKRFSPPVPSGRFGMDDTSSIRALKGLGASEARKALREIRSPFFSEAAEPFEPYHRL